MSTGRRHDPRGCSARRGTVALGLLVGTVDAQLQVARTDAAAAAYQDGDRGLEDQLLPGGVRHRTRACSQQSTR
jgi:hypothetical protein